MPPETTWRPPRFGSLLFWPILTIAAALYACVALSPRLLMCLELQHEYHVSQVKLVKLERQVEVLRRMSHALEHDPELKGELARVDFDASRPGDERIPVEARLRFDRLDSPSDTTFAQPELPWFTPFVRIFAETTSLRQLSLAIGAVLVLLGFGFLNDPSDSEASGEPEYAAAPEPPRSVPVATVLAPPRATEVASPPAEHAMASSIPERGLAPRAESSPNPSRIDRGVVNSPNAAKASNNPPRRSWLSQLAQRYRTTPAQ